MAITNHERVGKALDLLKSGIAPFIEREFKNAYQTKAQTQAAALLKLMWEAWNEVFRRTLGPAERSLVQELRDHRNKWAHQQSFSGDDTYRALDSAGRPALFRNGRGRKIRRQLSRFLASS